LTTVLGMTQSAVSHQLRVLRDHRLVKFRRDGKIVFYALDDQHIINLFREGLAHVLHD
ncbi:MAG: metalloregulator ArsR/SmtB family transcription factor, partial [Bacillota bacterium]|nr:metalloregulator ArsR/SmtB family transcription factor [Bacillota bacterium]